MAALLLEIKEAVEKTQLERFPSVQLENFERQYDKIVNKGFDCNPRSPPDNEEAYFKISS